MITFKYKGFMGVIMKQKKAKVLSAYEFMSKFASKRKAVKFFERYIKLTAFQTAGNKTSGCLVHAS